MLAFIGAYLFDMFIKIEPDFELKGEVIFFDFDEKKKYYYINQMKKLNLEAQAYQFARLKVSQNTNNLYKAPEKAFEVYEILKQFEKRVYRANK